MDLQDKEALIAQKRYNMADLLAIMSCLRSEHGCAWDRAQTHASIRRCLIEEAYEVADAIDKEDSDSLCEELGDLLFQIVFHAEIESESARFAFDDVVDGISKKMIERHPHVFAHPGDAPPDWNEIKRQKRGQTKLSQRLDEIPKALPALMRADKLIDRMAQTGKKPTDYAPDTVTAIPTLPPPTDHEAAGDILLAYVANCMAEGIDCERALADACDRLAGRVRKSEKSDGDGVVHK